MLSEWFAQNISNVRLYLRFDHFEFTFRMDEIFGALMFFLFLWASFHLITDIIMAFRAVFGFGYKKRKGGSH